MPASVEALDVEMRPPPRDAGGSESLLNRRPGQSSKLSEGTIVAVTELTDEETAVLPPRPRLYLGMFQGYQLFGLVLAVVLATTFGNLDISTEHPLANRMLAITSFVACFWVFEVLPLSISSLLPMVLLPMANVSSSAAVAQSYFNWVQMLVIGILIINVAFDKVKLLNRLGLLTLCGVGVGNPALVLAVFCGFSWFASMFFSVTSTTALLTPLACTIVDTARRQVTARGGKGRDLEHCERLSTGLLLAICCSSTAGGVGTIIGTPPNSVLAGQDIVAGKIDFVSWLSFGLPVSTLLVILIFVVTYFTFIRGVQVELDDADLRAALEALGPLNRDEKGTRLEGGPAPTDQDPFH